MSLSQFVVDKADEDEEYGSKIVFNDNPQNKAEKYHVT